MSIQEIPERVQLREERMWVPFGLGPDGEWMEYNAEPDSELVDLITGSQQPMEALSKWHCTISQRVTQRKGVLLIPQALQRILRLPVRQVYRYDSSVYLIEADGHIGRRLL